MAAAQFGIPIPQVFMQGVADMTLIRDSLRRAEALGFHSAWVQDQVIGDVPLLESVTLMSYAAACTTRLKLGVSVIVFPVRNPVQLAKSVSSLDHMSGGRVILGIGLGPPANARNFYRSFGVEYSERVRRFNEGVAVMKSLWTQPVTRHDGEFWHLDGTAMEPKPLQKPHPPLWFGGQHRDALRRAVRLSDGYMGAGPTTTREFAAHVHIIREALSESGRDPATFPLSKRVYLAVDDDADRAKRRLDEYYGARYPWMIRANPTFVADICVWGPPRQCIDGLRTVIDAGAGMIVLNPLWDYVGQMERLAGDVLPHLQGAGQ